MVSNFYGLKKRLQKTTSKNDFKKRLQKVQQEIRTPKYTISQ